MDDEFIPVSEIPPSRKSTWDATFKDLREGRTLVSTFKTDRQALAKRIDFYQACKRRGVRPATRTIREDNAIKLYLWLID